MKRLVTKRMDNIVSHMNCLQLCLYNICKKYHIADYLMFCNGWCFSYDASKDISKSLSIPLEDHKNTYLNEYQGLITNIIPFDSSNVEHMLHLISDTDCKDVIIHINSYECPWHRGFQKLNIPHYVHIIKVNHENKVLVCDDPYFNVFQMELPFENVLRGCKTIRVFQHEPINKDISSDKVLYDIHEGSNIKQITEDISTFAHKLLDIKTVHDLFDYMDDVYLCSNVRVLKFIADSRYGLSYLLNNLWILDDKTVDLSEIANQFEISGSLFEKVNHFYIKLYYRNSEFQVKLKSIHDKLAEIVEIENEIFNNLSQMGVQR